MTLPARVREIQARKRENRQRMKACRVHPGLAVLEGVKQVCEECGARYIAGG